MRFLVPLPVEYALDGSSHRGIARDLSSRGVFINTGEAVPVGRHIQMSIDWPVPLGSCCGLSLMIIGKVIRTETSGAAVKIVKYEFRVRPAASAAG